MSTLSTANIQTKAAATPPVIKDVNGVEVGQFCTAWVNFNGTTGTLGQSDVTIRGSFNVTSVTDNGVGNYTVSYTNAMDSINYSCVAAMGQGSVASGFSEAVNVHNPTATGCQVLVGCDGTSGATYTAQDAVFVCFAAFGGK